MKGVDPTTLRMVHGEVGAAVAVEVALGEREDGEWRRIDGRFGECPVAIARQERDATPQDSVVQADDEVGETVTVEVARGQAEGISGDGVGGRSGEGPVSVPE